MYYTQKEELQLYRFAIERFQNVITTNTNVLQYYIKEICLTVFHVSLQKATRQQ